MKKIIILALLFVFSVSLYAEAPPRTPANFLIIGGILGAIEIVHQSIKFFTKKSETKEIIQPPPIQEQIPPVTVQTQIIATTVETQLVAITIRTQEPIQQIVMVTNKPMQTNITQLSITNIITEEDADELIRSYSYEWESIEIDYYQVGIAYYRVGKKDKAREFLLHAVARKKNLKEATAFLKEKFKMTSEQIEQQSKVFR